MQQIAEKSVVARKRHTCSWYPFQSVLEENREDDHWIEPGETYRRTTIIDRGMGPRVWKSCLYHEAAARAMFSESGEPEHTEYDMSEQLHEWWGEAVWHADRGLPYPMPFEVT